LHRIAEYGDLVSSVVEATVVAKWPTVFNFPAASGQSAIPPRILGQVNFFNR
jgi:hypothetical protein